MEQKRQQRGKISMLDIFSWRHTMKFFSLSSFSSASAPVNGRRQQGACIVVTLSMAVLALLGIGGVSDLAAHLLKMR
jgi:hypothetical protein